MSIASRLVAEAKPAPQEREGFRKEIERLHKAKAGLELFVAQWIRKHGEVPFKAKPLSKRQGSDVYYLAHLSARKRGVWQLTRFDGGVPTGHSEYPTYNKMLQEEVVHWKELDPGSMEPQKSKKR